MCALSYNVKAADCDAKIPGFLHLVALETRSSSGYFDSYRPCSVTSRSFNSLTSTNTVNLMKAVKLQKNSRRLNPLTQKHNWLAAFWILPPVSDLTLPQRRQMKCHHRTFMSQLPKCTHPISSRYRLNLGLHLSRPLVLYGSSVVWHPIFTACLCVHLYTDLFFCLSPFKN